MIKIELDKFINSLRRQYSEFPTEWVEALREQGLRYDFEQGKVVEIESEPELTPFERAVQNVLEDMWGSPVPVREAKQYAPILLEAAAEQLKPSEEKRGMTRRGMREEKVEPIIEGLNTEFQKQVSSLIASAINREWEYTQGYVVWVAKALLEYAKNEIKPEWSEEDINKQIIILLNSPKLTEAKKNEILRALGAYQKEIETADEVQFRKGYTAAMEKAWQFMVSYSHFGDVALLRYEDYMEKGQL